MAGLKYADMTDDQRLVWARRFRDPDRRARAEAKVLEDIAARNPGEPMRRRPRRPAGSGELRKGS